MKKNQPIVVKGPGGLDAVVVPQASRPGSRQSLRIRTMQGDEYDVPVQALAARPDGSYLLTLNKKELERCRITPGHPAAQETVVPVIREELKVGKRQVESGKVVVTKTVRKRREVVDQPLMQERVKVERVPVNRYVDGPVDIRQEGDTLIVPVVEEVLVVEKRLMLKEELHITRERTETHESLEFMLLGEEARVERVAARPKDRQRKVA